MRSTKLSLLALTLVGASTFANQVNACGGAPRYTCHAPQPVVHTAQPVSWKTIQVYEDVMLYDYYGRPVRVKQLVEKLVPVVAEQPVVAALTTPATRSEVSAASTQTVAPTSPQLQPQPAPPTQPQLPPPAADAKRLPPPPATAPAPAAKPPATNQNATESLSLPRGSDVIPLAPAAGAPPKRDAPKEPTVQQQPSFGDQAVRAPLANDFVD